MELTTALPGTGAATESKEDLVPQYNVVLLDDNEHTYDYVIEMLQKLFFYSKADAFRRAVSRRSSRIRLQTSQPRSRRR